ncbi:response regulator [Bradyrhizobium sp. USDA 4353]
MNTSGVLGTLTNRHAKHTVLVVDDEVIIRMMISDELRELGLNVIECGDADEALQVLACGAQVSLLFTDVRMPGTMDGVALASTVKQDYPELTVVLTSAQRMPPGALCDQFFSKPWDLALVMSYIRSVIGA